MACVRRTRQRVVLAYNVVDDFGAYAAFDLVRLRGLFATYYREISSGGCRGEPCPSDYDPISQGIQVVDLRAHRRATVGTPARPAAGKLLVDKQGAIAWPVRADDGAVAIHVRDAEGARVLDTGQIPPGSLGLTAGGLLTWSNAGTAGTALLRHRASTATTLGIPLALTSLQDSFPVGSSSARVVLDAAGTAIVAWTSTPGVNITARPAGAYFARPFDVLKSLGRTEQPDLSVDRDGNALAVWLSRKGLAFRVQAATRNATGAVSQPVDIGAADGYLPAPRGAVAPSGDAVVVWTDRRSDDDAVIRAAVRPPGGSFGAPVAVSTSGSAFDPQVRMDAKGNAIVIWRNTRSLGPGAYEHTVEAATRSPGGAFSPPIALSGDGSSVAPDVALDSAGNALAVWLQSDAVGSPVLVATRPAGGEFSAPLEVPGSAGARSSRLAMNASGQAVLAWQTDDGLLASRRTPGGSFSAPQRVAASEPATFLQSPAIGPSGAAVVAWTANDGLNTIVRAAFASSTGSFTTPIDVSSSGTNAYGSDSAIDAAGRATFVWIDDNNRVFVAGRDIAGRPVAQTGLAGLAVRPSRVRAGRHIRVRYALSQRAEVRLTLQRGLAGRAGAGGLHCDRPSSANRNHYACTRYVRMRGDFTRTSTAGPHSVVLPSGALRRPGPYRLIAVPVANGRRGTITRAVFRVLP